jgi:hypothetical protein
MDTSADERLKGRDGERHSKAMPDFGLKSTPQPPYSPYICPSGFFFFGWLKLKQQQQQLTDPNRLFKAVDEIG